MENQKINIKTVAETIGHSLFIGAYADSEHILKEIDKTQKLQPNETRLGNLFDEMLHFYLNLTDRFAFQYLGEKRGEFFDEVSIQVFKNYLDGHKLAGGKVDDETLYRIFNEAHKKRQEEYGSYKFTTEKEEGMKGNLFYEFESRLAEIFGAKNDPLIIMFIHAVLVPNVGKFHELCKKIMSEI